jgi:hypothetical protein
MFRNTWLVMLCYNVKLSIDGTDSCGTETFKFRCLPPAVPLFPACCFSMTSQLHRLNADILRAKPCNLVYRDQHFGWIQCLLISLPKWQSYNHTTESTSPTVLYKEDVRRRISQRWTLKIGYLTTPRYVGPCHHGMGRRRVVNGGTASNMEGSYEYTE